VRYHRLPLVARPEDLLEGLNPEQAAAVSHGDGPLLVLAGAGSGKTRVLTRRLAWLVARGVPQEAIVAVTFTNKAAGEMKERVGTLLGTDRPRSYVGTFHAWGVRLLRRFAHEAGLPRGFVVFDADDQLALVRRAMKEVAIPEKSATPRQIQAKISSAKNEGISPEDFPRRFGDFLGSRLADVARAYEKALASAQALDFDDLLVLSARLVGSDEKVRDLLRRSIRHLLVDEYQDTNRVQARLVKLVTGEAGNLFVVGDEDQSIYRWRGADVSNILEFTRQFPTAKTVRLERNYRSRAPILRAASALVAENRRRLGKTLKATKPGGEKVTFLSFDEERDEAKEIVSRVAAARRARPQGEVAVLFRTNAQSRPFEDELLRSNLPYILVGGTKFYERTEVKDLLAYLRLARNPADDVSFRRVVNVPARGVGAATLEALEARAVEKGVPLLAAVGDLPTAMTERARKALSEFSGLVKRLAHFGALEGNGAGAAMAFALEETGLARLYENSLDPQDEARRENLDELLAAAREHERAASSGAEGEDPSIAGFLDAVTLRTDADEADERRGILLITLHAAKGLEFDDVFLAGAEDGSLPHASSKSDDDELEEERRLAYVGMTRAKERLTISWVRRRMVRGEWMSRDRSPFLDAIPGEVVAYEDMTSGFAGRPGDFFEGKEGGGAFGGRRSSGGVGFEGRGGGTRGGSLFPDYENESQEAPPSGTPDSPSKKSLFGRFPMRSVTPVRPVMKRTPPPPTASCYRRGSKVLHPEYGVGVVLTVEGSGDAEKLVVYFDRAGRKKFVARFANLSPA
jgi:DNA helicase II / ATP-dependent DNA helicase PcrA